MEEIINYLEDFGFSSMEAKVYITLLENRKLTGYQVSKLLDISKSSAYSALNNLYKKNCIFLLPGENNVYTPEEPSILINRIKKKLDNSGEKLIEMFKDSKFKITDNNFYNILGLENNIEKTRELISSARKEILINTEINILKLEKEIREAAKKGVRILVFNWLKKEVKDLPVELYSISKHPEESSGRERNKTVLVCDYEVALVFGGESSRETIGTLSKHRNFVEILTEHISTDIYNGKIIERTGKSPITDADRIYTIRENAFFNDKV